MSSMENAKRFVYCGLTLLVAAPIVFYTGLLAKDAAIKLWKVGWDSRPFIYISTAGILVYVLYATAVCGGLALLWKVTKDRFFGCCAIVIAEMLAMYWFGLLT